MVDEIVLLASGYEGVLEIGPGAGALTTRLVEGATRVTAIEFDKRMIAILSEICPGATVVEADVLKVDLGELLESLPAPRCVVSNMPYSITGPLLTKIAAQRERIDSAILMMQREVGERVLALPGDRRRGSLSLFLQLQFSISKVCNVPPGAFVPRPKVSSVVLQLTPLDGTVSQQVFDVVRAGFVQPRKTLVNNLSGDYARIKVIDAIVALGLSESIRPHQLEDEHWIELGSRL